MSECFNGHEMTEENTRVTSRGRILCRKCALINRDKWRAKQRAKTGYRNRPPWMPFEDWFWSWVDKQDDDQICWLWQRTPNEDGYGRVRRKYEEDGAHRVAWELSNGVPVPEGLDILHSCDIRLCCNPNHLRPGTNDDNMRDMVERARNPRGEEHHKTVITLDQAKEIKRLRGEGYLYREIAALTGVKKATVSDICNGRTWKEA